MSNFKSIFQQFATKNHITPDDQQSELIDQLNHIYDGLQNPRKSPWFSKKTKATKGLYIWGGVGRGKTMIMDVFYDALPILKKRRVHFNIFMLDIHARMKDIGGQSPLQKIAQNIAEDVHVLCFDEFQVYDIADAMILSELFKELFNQGMIVIATSNVNPDDLYKNGLQRSRFLPFIPLLKKHMDIYHLDTDHDYRQQALRENGVYFVNDGYAMERLFKTITSPHKVTSFDLEVSKRFIHVEKSTDHIGWFDFKELCEKPRAAVDYDAIANSYRTVFIHEVPILVAEKRNEAKRFILLIDTLYDAKIRVVINAADTPQNLYKGMDHQFEFERTISRLLEMQGEEYLSNFK